MVVSPAESSTTASEGSAAWSDDGEREEEGDSQTSSFSSLDPTRPTEDLLNSGDYAPAFMDFVRRTEESAAFQEWLDKQVASRNGFRKSTQVESVLSVGSSNGEKVDFPLLTKVLLPFHKELELYVAMEGQQDSSKEFEKTAKHLKDTYPTHRVEFKVLREFFDNESFSDGENRFDVVVVSHMMHYIPPARRISVLQRMLALLADGGELLFIHQGKDGIWQLQEDLIEGQNGFASFVGDFDTENLKSQHYGSEQLQDDLRLAISSAGESYEISEQSLWTGFQSDGIGPKFVQFAFEMSKPPPEGSPLVKAVQDWLDERTDGDLSKKYGGSYVHSPNVIFRVSAS